MHSLRETAIPLILSALFIGTPSPASAEGTSTAATVRYRIERKADAPERADTGCFLLWGEDLHTTNVCLQVVSTNGVAVGHQILWAAEGEPAKVLFDCSGHDAAYHVRVGPDLGKPPDWTPRSGLILETRTRGQGEPTTWQDIRRICRSSLPVLGRSLVPNIFLGIHPHGPTEDVVAIFKGAFSAEKDGKYRFATISTDASCIFIDGQMVAEWPGWHDYHGGRRGEHHGEIALKAGRHEIQCLNVEKGAGFTIEAAWKPPGKEQMEIMPASAFPAVASFQISSCEVLPPNTPVARFAWEILGHFTIEETTLVKVGFRALSGGPRCAWTFDDGTRETGRTVEHLFLSPGMRTVTLEIEGKRTASTVSRRIHVHPLWTQEKEMERSILRKERHLLIKGNYASAPVADLVNVFRIAADLEDIPLGTKFAALCLAREKDLKPACVKVLCEIALFVQRPEAQEYALSQRAFKALIASETSTPEQKGWAMVHLSGLLIHGMDRPEEAQQLLNQVKVENLPDVEKRLKKIYEADALLTLGHVDAARAVYLSAGTVADPGDIRMALKRRGRLETARDYLGRGEFDEAERIIRAIEWETPVERLGAETGLIMAKVCVGRQEFQRALLLCRGLLRAAETDVHRADILYNIVDICLSMKRDKDAAGAYNQLLKEHPYSEAAARAKEKWGGRIKSLSDNN